MRDQRVVLFLVAAFIIVGGCGGGGGDSGTPAVVKATVSGTVLDSRNNPVPAATVTINSTPVTTSTNSSGYFSAEIETGDHEIIVEKAGYSMFNTGFSVPSSSPVDLGSLIASGFYPAYLDSDDDGYGDPDASVAYTTDNIPTSYVVSGDDCDDTLASVNPGASEVCNNVDDNCSGTVDEGLTQYTYYEDSDADSYGNTGVSQQTCMNTPPSGYVTDSTDCDDALAAVNPGASEVCNSVDDDCDLSVDEEFGAGGSVTYTDLDGASGLVLGDSCGTGDCTGGTVVCATDETSLTCTTESLAGAEVCDGSDNDCDGVIDDGFSTTTYYQDSDGDSFGNAGMPQDACAQPTGYVLDDTDCDDGSSSVNPGAVEACNGVNDDCDAGTLDGAGESWAGSVCDGTDSDLCEEGTYSCTGGTQVCSDNTVDDLDLCGGGDQDCNPATADGSDETWFGSACDGADSDLCEEGTYACVVGSQNCSDTTGDDVEICDGLDNDCNGQVDNGLAIAGTFYFDGDSDGYGDPAVADTLCGAYGSYVADNTDCQPSDGNSYPGASEVCDNIDNDCDTFIDESVSQVFYQDADKDGFGDSANVSSPGCDPPLGYVRTDTDCDDTDSTSNPLALEVCGDGVDQDCSSGDLSCPNYSIQASTLSPISVGDWWDYAVTGDDTGMMYRTVWGLWDSDATGVSSYDVEDAFYMDVWPNWPWDRFLIQDSNGTTRQTGMWWEDESAPNWVTTGSGGSFLYYPSPMAVGQSGSSTFNFIYDNSTGSYAYSVLAVESVSTPLGSIEAFQIASFYSQSWPATANTDSEDYYESSTIWVHPEIGEIKRDYSYDEYYAGSLGESGALTWTLQEGSYFDTTLSCGGVGGGSGWLEKLEGTWYGGGVDDFIVTSYHDWEVTLTMDGSGNITLINLDSSDTSITGIVTPVDDSLYTIEFNDASTGQIIVDQTFNYMVFIGNFGFSVHGTTEHSDIFFAVLQKGATSLPTFDNPDVDGSWNGFGYAYCSGDDSFYRFAPGNMTMSGVNPTDPRTVAGIGPSSTPWSGTFSLYSQVLGWWDGTRQDTSGMLFLRLSPDKQFAAAYLEVGFGPLGTGRFLVPEDYAFFVMHR